MDQASLQRACDSTERFVAGVRPDQYALPTPCSEWDVHGLLNHILGTLALGAALLTDTPPAAGVNPGEIPTDDLVGDNAVKAYRTGVESLLEAARGGSIERVHVTPLGEMPGAALAGFTAMDVVVHGWDLAKATGQDATLDEALAAQTLAFAHQAITAETRAPRIGEALPVGKNASTTDQLVAYLGRRP